tara:strand:- start:178 stop:399 length:222 start_codon:yes stop_codon:yes gene_type:complete
MKFVLAYTICSAITGFCNTPAVHPVKFDTWTDCTKAGASVTIRVTNEFKEKFNEEKLYISYFCNENNSDKTTT